ncbi:MAG: 3'-5' exonuclease [Coriobacteriia bacterium]|nr:3'-5' exonuclease [Coriobacteriia bacterium]
MAATSSSETWVAIDFETATREATSACALGVAIVRDGRVADRRSWLIQPPFNEYEYRNMLIHGISPEDTELALDFREVWFELQPILAEGPLLAHNAVFDVRVLRALLGSFELPNPAHEYVCTVGLSRAAFPELRRHTLDAMCDHCGIALRHHDATSDAEACAHVALTCAEVAGAKSIRDAVRRLGVKVGRV